MSFTQIPITKKKVFTPEQVALCILHFAFAIEVPTGQRHAFETHYFWYVMTGQSSKRKPQKTSAIRVTWKCQFGEFIKSGWLSVAWLADSLPFVNDRWEAHLVPLELGIPHPRLSTADDFVNGKNGKKNLAVLVWPSSQSIFIDKCQVGLQLAIQ